MTHWLGKPNWLSALPLVLVWDNRRLRAGRGETGCGQLFFLSLSLLSSPTATPPPIFVFLKCLCPLLLSSQALVSPFSCPQVWSILCLYPSPPGPTCFPAACFSSLRVTWSWPSTFTWHRRASHFWVSGKKAPTPVPSLPPGTPHSGLQTDLLGPQAPGGRPRPGLPTPVLPSQWGIFHPGHHQCCPARALEPPLALRLGAGGKEGRHQRSAQAWPGRGGTCLIASRGQISSHSSL